MCTVREILSHKNPGVATIGPRESALDAAVAMNQQKVGSLMVLDGDRVVGIITERDLLQRVLAEQRDAGKTPVEDVMTTEILCCQLRDADLVLVVLGAMNRFEGLGRCVP